MNKPIYIITPFKKIGEILFSDSRQEIRYKLGGQFNSGEYAFNDTFELYDYFVDADIKVLYNKDEQLGAVEFYQGNVVFSGINFFDQKYEEIERVFLNLDPLLEFIDIGFTCHKYGIGVGYKERDEMPDSVIIFKKIITPSSPKIVLCSVASPSVYLTTFLLFLS